MLDFVLFAATFAIALIIMVIYLYPARIKTSSIPGLPQTDPIEGNYADIKLAGSFTDFLIKLHEDFGDIASFWMGSELVVSVSSPDLYKQNKHVYDRPNELFQFYEPLFKENSTFFSCGQVARKKHQILCDVLKHVVQDGTFTQNLTDECSELVSKWQNTAIDQHIPLFQYMKTFTLKCSAKILFSKSDFASDIELVQFMRHLDTCFSELEHQWTEISSEESKARSKRFNTSRQLIYEKLTSIIGKYKNDKTNSSAFLKLLIKSDQSEDEIINDVMTCLFFFFSLSSGLTWALYFISTHEDVQDKVLATVMDGGDRKYILNIIKETLRLAPVFTWTARKQPDVETQLGGHIIAKQTPVIHALCVTMMNDDYWTMPKLFNPDRFQEDVTELSFVPFGFSGGRSCPAEHLVMKQLAVCLELIFSTVKLVPVDDQVIEPYYGAITKPSREVWITVVPVNK